MIYMRLPVTIFKTITCMRSQGLKWKRLQEGGGNSSAIEGSNLVKCSKYSSGDKPSRVSNSYVIIPSAPPAQEEAQYAAPRCAMFR